MVEVWDHDCTSSDDKIDNFTIPLSSSLQMFNLSNSITVQGHYGVGNLTLSYGNITTDPTPCNAMEWPMSSTHYGNPSTDPSQNKSVEWPIPSTSPQTNQGP